MRPARIRELGGLTAYDGRMNGRTAIPPHIYQLRIDVGRLDRRGRRVAPKVPELPGKGRASTPELTAFYEIPSFLGPAEFVAALRAMISQLRAVGSSGGTAAGNSTSVRKKGGASRCGLW